MSFKIEGQLINLLPTVLTDIDDYERWNNPKVVVLNVSDGKA